MYTVHENNTNNIIKIVVVHNFIDKNLTRNEGVFKYNKMTANQFSNFLP